MTDEVVVIYSSDPAVILAAGQAERETVTIDVGSIGPPGPPGPAGSGNYEHIQGPAAAVWEIEHNLGKHPSITVVDSSGTPVYGDEEYVDINNVRVTFSGGFAGKAFLN